MVAFFTFGHHGTTYWLVIRQGTLLPSTYFPPTLGSALAFGHERSRHFEDELRLLPRGSTVLIVHLRTYIAPSRAHYIWKQAIRTSITPVGSWKETGGSKLTAQLGETTRDIATAAIIIIIQVSSPILVLTAAHHTTPTAFASKKTRRHAHTQSINRKQGEPERPCRISSKPDATTSLAQLMNNTPMTTAAPRKSRPAKAPAKTR